MVHLYHVCTPFEDTIFFKFSVTHVGWLEPYVYQYTPFKQKIDELSSNPYIIEHHQWLLNLSKLVSFLIKSVRHSEWCSKYLTTLRNHCSISKVGLKVFLQWWTEMYLTWTKRRLSLKWQNSSCGNAFLPQTLTIHVKAMKVEAIYSLSKFIR